MEPIKPPATPPSTAGRKLNKAIDDFAARAETVKTPEEAEQLAVDLLHARFVAERAWERAMALMVDRVVPRVDKQGNQRPINPRNDKLTSMRRLSAAVGPSPYTINKKVDAGREQLRNLAGKRDTA